jgi:hypothetical protein
VQISKSGLDSRPSTDVIEVFVTTLEASGASFILNDHNELRVALDGLGPPPPYADAISAACLALKEQIKDFLALRAVEPETTH